MSELTKSQIKILSYLLNKDERKARFNEIVKEVGLARATLSRNLKRLEEKGYVKREIDSSSKEYPPPVYYFITEEGMNALREAIPFNVDMELVKKGDIVEIRYKIDDLTKEALEGLAKAEGYDISDFLKAFTYCLGWWLEYKYKKTGNKELKKSDKIHVLSILRLLRLGLIDSLKEYWSLEVELDRLEREIKKDEELYKRFAPSLKRLQKQLNEFRENIKRTIFEILDKTISKEVSKQH